MSRRLAAAAGLAPAALAACLSTPPYEPPVSGLTYTQDGSGGTVAAPGLALHFATGPGFHFPDALTIDGKNVIQHDVSQPCYGEDQVGVMLSPTPRISPDTSAPLSLNQITATLRGPAVVQVVLDWNSQFTCARNRPGGTSTYTVFLDGRIIRHDTLEDQQPDMFGIGSCACGNADTTRGFNVESYWTFAPSLFASLLVPGSNYDPAQPLPTNPDMGIPNFYAACLDAGSFQLGFAWSRAISLGNPKIAGSPTQIVFSRERMVGMSALDPLTWETNDALFVERNGCQIASNRAAEHATAGLLSVNGATDGIAPSLIDGIYGGDRGDGQAGIAVPDGHSTLAPTLPRNPGDSDRINSSFAVRLQFPHAIDAMRASAAGKTGAWYLLQRLDGANWIAWFRDPLTPGETIAIDTE